MDKIASDAAITPEQGVKYAAHGFAAMLSNPSSGLSPQQVQDAGVEFTKRAAARMKRHLKIKDLLLEHAATPA